MASLAMLDSRLDAATVPTLRFLVHTLSNNHPRRDRPFLHPAPARSSRFGTIDNRVHRREGHVSEPKQENEGTPHDAASACPPLPAKRRGCSVLDALDPPPDPILFAVNCRSRKPSHIMSSTHHPLPFPHCPSYPQPTRLWRVPISFSFARNILPYGGRTSRSLPSIAR